LPSKSFQKPLSTLTNIKKLFTGSENKLARKDMDIKEHETIQFCTYTQIAL